MASLLAKFLNRTNYYPVIPHRETYSQKILRVSALVAASHRPAEHHLKEIWSPELRHSLLQQSPILAQWFDEVERATRLCVQQGKSLQDVLVDCAQMVRSDEVRIQKAKILKKQFAFQGAVLVVAPWGVVYFCGWPHWNGPLLIGSVLQAVGLGIFSWFANNLTKETWCESHSVRRLYLLFWIRSACGADALGALKESLQVALAEATDDLKIHWMSWYEGFKSHGKRLFYQWPRSYHLSEQYASALQSLLSEGAALGNYLKCALQCMEYDRQFKWEEKLSLAPSRMSLILCGFFAPAVFFLLLSTLWNQLQVMIE